MTLNNLLNYTAPFSIGSNQFLINSVNMNNVNGKRYYNATINLNVLKQYGIYAFSNSLDNKLLYIGMAGTLKNDGTYKNQNLNGRLSMAPRDGFPNGFEYFRNLMNNNNFESLSFLVIYTNIINPPACFPGFVEVSSIHQFYTQNNVLPMFNKEI